MTEFKYCVMLWLVLSGLDSGVGGGSKYSSCLSFGEWVKVWFFNRKLKVSTLKMVICWNLLLWTSVYKNVVHFSCYLHQPFPVELKCISNWLKNSFYKFIFEGEMYSFRFLHFGKQIDFPIWWPRNLQCINSECDKLQMRILICSQY